MVSLKYSPDGHLLDYVIMPRHSDLIVDAVNILAPRPRILDISLESSIIAHPCCIYLLPISPVSHSKSTVVITDVTDQAKEHSPA